MSHDQPDPQETRPLDSSEIRRLRITPGAILRERYRLDSELGRGGMGIVFRATDLQLDREVAVKVVPESDVSTESRQRLLREARSAAALNHPHVVAVHDVGEDLGVPFFVMELVEGRTLREQPPGDLKQAVEIALQICAALEHAHGHHIVHRDLKPENILLTGSDENPSVKLADLGLAVPLRGSRLSRSGTVAGTVAYMAPEQALGNPVDARTDLYALGVVLYELTTGRLPFTGDDPLAVVSQHVHAPVVPPRALKQSFPRGLETVILRLLAKDPEQRYADAGEVRTLLARSLDMPDSGQDDEAAASVALLDALARGRLVGRAAELAETREIWRRALDGRGHAVLVSGEPGAGKTRLCREILIQAALDGAVVLSGGCYEYEATTPYLPLVEAVRRWVRELRDDQRLTAILGDGAPRLARLAPEIETRLGPFPVLAELPPHEERLLFFDAVAGMLRELARTRGVLLYIDDLHWADSGTLWLLGHLLRHLREERVMVLASYRDTELDRAHPLAKALVDLNRERLTTRIALHRLGFGDTRAQLGALLNEDVSMEFAQAVHDETEGNPFFVEEMLKALIEQGSVRRESGRWERVEIEELELPQSMKAAIGNRLDRVSPECNDVLRAAAILGKIFSFEELVAAAGDLGEDPLLDALDEAVTAQLILADRDETFAFTHDKIREVLYEEMNPIRRRRLHRRTAEGLERVRVKAGVAAETLAYHYIEAGEYERGLVLAKEAAVEAERVFAYDEAAAAWERALECAEALDLPEEAVRLEEALGNVYFVSGNSLSAVAHFERALAGATDPAHRARLQCRAASSYVTTGDERGLRYVREALEFLDPATDPVDTAHALSIEARFHHLATRHEKAIELLERAVGLLRDPAPGETATPQEAAVVTDIYGYLAGAFQHLGQFEDGNRWAEKAIEFGQLQGYPVAEAMGLEFLGENGISMGEFETSLGYALREREVAERVHSRERYAWTYLVVSLATMLLERHEESDAEYRKGIEVADSLGEVRLALLLRTFHTYLLGDTGKMAEAQELAASCLKTAETLGFLHGREEARRALASLAYRRGDHAEAVRWSDEMLEIHGDSRAVVSRLWMGAVHVEALVALGRHEDARGVFEDWAGIVSRCQSPYFRKEVERVRAVLS